MVRRRSTGLPARITFTGDFHELLTGDLCRSRPLQVAYDPSRIVPADAPIQCGEPERPVTLHARFGTDQPEVTLPLQSPAGIVAAPIVDTSRHRCLVVGTLTVPADAASVDLCFSYADRDGSARRDDDDGARYRFRFPCQDIAVERAAVIALPGGEAAAFAVEATSVAEVERLQVRYRLLAEAGRTVGEVNLVASEDASGHKRWASPPQRVPSAAVVRFKLFYWIDGVRFKDDDGGNYYLAPDPESERVPPPPAQLLAAARTWVW